MEVEFVGVVNCPLLTFCWCLLPEDDTIDPHNTHTNMVEPADESCHQKHERRKVLCFNTRLPG